MQSPTFAYQLYQVCRYGFLLLVSIRLAWLSDDAVVNAYELLLLLGGSLTFFWVSGLYDGYVIAYRGASAAAQPKLTQQTFLISLPLALFSAVGVWLIGKYGLSGQLSDTLLLFYAGFLLFDSLSHLLTYHLLVRGNSLGLMAYGIGSYALYFLLVVLPFAWGGSLETSMQLLLVLAGAKCLLCIGWLYKPLFGQVPERSHMWTLIRIGGPLTLAILLSQSAQYVDGYLVEEFFTDQFAVFRYGAKELPIVLLLANSISVVRSGDIAADLRDGTPTASLELLRGSSRRLTWGLFPLSLLLLGMSTWLFETVLGPAFIGAVPVFDLYLLLVIPRLLFPQALIRGYQRTYVMTISAAIELVLNVGLSLWLMQYWGIAGIAAATVLAFSVEKLVLFWYCSVKLKIGVGAYTDILPWLAGTALMLGGWLLKYVV